MPEKVKKGAAPAAVERPVKYPTIEARVCIGPKALTVTQAKEYLGWEEETDAVKFGNSHVAEVSALVGKKVRLTNNTRNRYITPGWLRTLRQEHLQKRWRFNGESIVIGKTGEVNSGQHRLLSLILAEFERNGPKGDHWKENWPGEVTMETLLVFGVDEGDDTFKTLNCGKPGTFAEYLYRSEHLSKVKAADRQKIARLADYTIRTLWDRTGAKSNPFAPTRTHGEAEDFLERHPKVLKAVKHLYEENTDGNISAYVSPGTAAGLMYLMAASRSDGDVYLNKVRIGEASEKMLDMSLWDKANDFWVDFNQGKSESILRVKQAIRGLDNPDSGTGATSQEKEAVIALAWPLYAEDKDITLDDLQLSYRTDEYGVKHLSPIPTVGGIDVGKKARAPETANDPADGAEAEEVAQTEEEAAEAAEAARKKRADELAERMRKDRGTFADEIKALKDQHGGALLLFKRGPNYASWGEDAVTLARTCKLVLKASTGMKLAEFPDKNLDEMRNRLVAAGVKVVLADAQNKPGPTPSQEAAEKSAANGKPPVETEAPKEETKEPIGNPPAAEPEAPKQEENGKKKKAKGGRKKAGAKK